MSNLAVSNRFMSYKDERNHKANGVNDSIIFALMAVFYRSKPLGTQMHGTQKY